MFLQLFFNSLVTGLLLALVAVGFNLIFNVTRVFHLAHAAIYVAGAYAFIQFLEIRPDPSFFSWIISFILSLLFIALLSFLIEYLVYRPLSFKNTGQAITLIASMGVYLFLVNLIALLYGNETRLLAPNLGNSFSFLRIIIVPIQAVQLAVSVLILSTILFITRTKWFLQVRAIISNEAVASVLGVDVKKIRFYVMGVGGLLVTIAAILSLYDTGISPNSGMNITLSSVVAVIIGGKGSVRGTVLASLLIVSLQTITEWFLSAQWKDGITFLLLIIVILWRTEGIVSFKMRLEEK